MSSITFSNISVDGFPFTKIIQVKIAHRPNDHGYAEVCGEMPPKEAKDCIARADEKTGIKISVVGDDAKTLFVGGILNLSMQEEAQYSVVTIKAVTSSYLLDIKKESQSFQNTKKKYSEIVTKAYNGNGKVVFTVKDKPIDTIVVQLGETNWEFTRRMASRFNSVIFADITATKPMVTVGLPEAKSTKKIKTTSSKFVKNDKLYNQISQNGLVEGSKIIRQDFMSLFVESYEYLYLGDKLNVNDVEYYVKGIESELVDGIMNIKYELVGKTAFVGELRGSSCSGRSLVGQVKEVKQDMVRVHLIEIDEKYDKETDWWFPYSTPYSSKDSSGWYVMPEVNDYVRILFPSSAEVAAFAASSVNTAPLKDPKHKSFKAPGGKEILIDEKGVYIICKHQKIFIDLTESDGIKIISAENITVSSSANVTIQAEKDVQVLAKDQILLGTADSMINITPSKIVMSAKNVLIT